MTDSWPIGNQTAWTAPDWLAPFRWCKEHGFGAFEWFADKKGTQGWEFADADAPIRAAICREARQAGLRLTVHAPQGCDPTTVQGQAELRASVDFAYDVGARLVVLHLPPCEQEHEFVAALGSPIAWARDSGVQWALENTVHHSPGDCNRVLGRLLGRYGPEIPVGLCFDVGHANLCSATHHDYIGFVDGLASELPILHVHLHENWGDSDQHLVVFTGPAREDDRGVRMLVRRLVARGYRGAFILEQWPEPPELLDLAVARLQRLFVELGGQISL